MMNDCMIEFHRSAREEILYRVKNRDNYLKLQLFSQAILLAISGGVKLGGAEAATPIPMALSLSVPLSLIFLCLYYRENSLVAHLSIYLRTLIPLNENKEEDSVLINWDSSVELMKYGKTTKGFRIIGELTAFFIIPTCLFLVWMFPSIPKWLKGTGIIIEIVLLIVLIRVILKFFNYRRKA